jgi:GNAT superfamily N-acetyltransferase
VSFKVTRNHEIIDKIINHPDVKPYVLVDGSRGDDLNSSILFENGAFAIVTPNGDGGAVLIPDGNGGAEAHTFAEPSARGGAVAKACLEATKSLLQDKVFDRIYGYTPTNNKMAMKFNEKIGYKPIDIKSVDRGYGVKEEVMLYEACNGY